MLNFTGVHKLSVTHHHYALDMTHNKTGRRIHSLVGLVTHTVIKCGVNATPFSYMHWKRVPVHYEDSTVINGDSMALACHGQSV